MKQFKYTAIALVALIAFASVAPAQDASAIPATPIVVRIPPKNWQLLDDSVDHYPGISLLRAERELLAGKSPKQSVIVAVIDGGVDTAHAALRTRLWTNTREIAGNGKDDDHDGHIDDVHGWDFIGGADGKDVNYDTFVLTRMLVRCAGTPKTMTEQAMPLPDSTTCQRVSDQHAKKKVEISTTLDQMRQIEAVLARALPLLRHAAGTDSLTPAIVAAIQDTTAPVRLSREIYLQLAQEGATPEAVDEAVTEYGVQLQYGLDTSFDPRPIVGDNFANVTQRDYGNADVTGPDAKHGTHVSGIIAAVPQGSGGMQGISSAALIMPVRAIPDGDERDKDVANAIRYAVDHGARVINMSFGKPYSPFKSAVDDAVKYADAHGVLMVLAAGNDGASLDTAPNFPTPYFNDGRKAADWIEVGASSWRGGDTVATAFSNYSHTKVDVFAPGEDLYSSIQGGGYERQSGTSMAAPVVSGLAALIMSYYPSLTAAQVRQIILDSATRYDRPSNRPGARNGETVPFASLSVTGGIVNAYNALRMAQQESGGK